MVCISRRGLQSPSGDSEPLAFRRGSLQSERRNPSPYMYEKCRTVFSPASDAFDQGARPKSPSATHGNEPVAALRPCEFVGGLGDEETSSRAERMTQRNGATVGVDARHIGPDLLGPGQHH